MYAGRLSVRPSVNTVTWSWYICTECSDFSETCYKYSSCEWGLRRRFSRSEVKVTTRSSALLRRRHTFRWRGVAAQLSCLALQPALHVRDSTREQRITTARLRLRLQSTLSRVLMMYGLLLLLLHAAKYRPTVRHWSLRSLWPLWYCRLRDAWTATASEVDEITAFRNGRHFISNQTVLSQYRFHFLLAAVNAERQLLVGVSACDRQTHRQLTFGPSCPSHVLLQLLSGVRFATISSKLLAVVPCCRCVRLIVIFTLYGTGMFGRSVGRCSLFILPVYICAIILLRS